MAQEFPGREMMWEEGDAEASGMGDVRELPEGVTFPAHTTHPQGRGLGPMKGKDCIPTPWSSLFQPCPALPPANLHEPLLEKRACWL